MSIVNTSILQPFFGCMVNMRTSTITDTLLSSLVNLVIDLTIFNVQEEFVLKSTWTAAIRIGWLVKYSLKLKDCSVIEIFRVILEHWVSEIISNIHILLKKKTYQLSLVTRKPVFGVCDQVRHERACVATEATQRLEISDLETRGIILSRQRTTNALIRLRGCAGWSASLLFAYGINRFSHDVAQL